jgi:tRNA nucleotidyltransferase (CCA-adding enzyme)
VTGPTAQPASRIRRTPREAIDALALRCPGGRELLALAEERRGISLVGGAVRDLMLGLSPRELDVVVDEGAADLAAALVASLPRHHWPAEERPEPTVHDRFGTASVEWVYGRLDVAERRAETYPRPGSLPEVRAGGVAEDLARRDFTVNAMSLPLEPEARGELAAADHALEDLAAGRLRVLHEQSFTEDPTRLLRLARYEARLGFEVEPHTLRLAEAAVVADALRTVSGGRVAAELWLAIEESDEALAAMGELGVLAALGLPPHFDAQLARAAFELMPPDGRYELLQMAVLFHDPQRGEDPAARAAAGRVMDEFEFFASTREDVLASAFGVDSLAEQLEKPLRPAQLHGLLIDRPVEAVAIAAALAARRSSNGPEAARRWFDELRHVRLQITGDDLIAAGIPEGPEIGRRLQAALELRLEGELDDSPEAQLRAALEAAP